MLRCDDTISAYVFHCGQGMLFDPAFSVHKLDFTVELASSVNQK